MNFFSTYYKQIPVFHRKALIVFLSTLFLSFYPIWSQFAKTFIYPDFQFNFTAFNILQTFFIITVSAYIKYVFAANDKAKVSDNKSVTFAIITICLVFTLFIPDTNSKITTQYTVCSILLALFCICIMYSITYKDKITNDEAIREDVKIEKFTSDKIIADDDEDEFDQLMNSSYDEVDIVMGLSDHTNKKEKEV